MNKRKVYLSQVNSTYGKGAFLPYSVGLLQAYALKDPIIKENYEFKELLYLREPVEQVAERWKDADVVGLSMYIWNGEYTLALARAIRKVNEDTLIVVGGPHVPNQSEDFLYLHSRYIDIAVHGEGEESFYEILKGNLKKDWPQLGFYWYGGVRGVSYIDLDGTVHKSQTRVRTKVLDDIPSPYLTGVFDNFPYDKYEFHPTQETHRGCPFPVRSATGGASQWQKCRSSLTNA